MNHCVDCGSEIPADQRTCSMCYGDIVDIKAIFADSRQKQQFMVEAIKAALAREWIYMPVDHVIAVYLAAVARRADG